MKISKAARACALATIIAAAWLLAASANAQGSRIVDEISATLRNRQCITDAEARQMLLGLQTEGAFLRRDYQRLLKQKDRSTGVAVEQNTQSRLSVDSAIADVKSFPRCTTPTGPRLQTPPGLAPPA